MQAKTLGIIALSLFSVAPGASAAHTFDKTIRIVVPYAAGGGTDAVARLAAHGLSEKLGQTVIVENKGGANGQIGTQYVKDARPDGTVLLFTVDHSVINVPLTMPSAGYTADDFVPLGQAARTRLVLTIPPNQSYTNFTGYTEAIKSDP